MKRDAADPKRDLKPRVQRPLRQRDERAVMKITVLIDNNANEGLKAEWGLSLLIEHKGAVYLADTGGNRRVRRKRRRAGHRLVHRRRLRAQPRPLRPRGRTALVLRAKPPSSRLRGEGDGGKLLVGD